MERGPENSLSLGSFPPTSSMDTINNIIRSSAPGDISQWENSCYPIGNGFMGASFFGGTVRERTVLNEKTLWTGGPSPERPGYNGGNRKNAYRSVKKVQELLSAGKYDEAVQLLPELTCESDEGFGAYQLFCDLVTEWKGIDASDISCYERRLDLDRSLYSCGFISGGTKHTRQAFASYPAGVICIRYSCDREKGLSFELSAEKTHEGAEIVFSGTRLSISGALADNGLRYHAALDIRTDGELSGNGRGFSVSGASEAVIVIAAATDYSDIYPAYRSGEDPRCITENRLARCRDKSFDELYGEHYADYSALYGRAALVLNNECGLPDFAPELLEKYRKGDKKAASQLIPLYFQYGRYLLISSSRKGSLPANLQGVWNESNTPPWCCDYHINVNLQMNYWGAFNTNIAETAEPLVRYLDSLRAPGRVTAREYYNIVSDSEHPENGWTAHTQSNPFGFTAPGWEFCWGWSTAAAAWLMLNIYDYYDFTRDEEFFRERIYPIMREAARFYSQWLIWDDKQKRYVSSPTYSPEHGPVTVGNTYEQSLIFEFYSRFFACPACGGEDEELFRKMNEQFRALEPFSVSSTGLLKEWFEEDEPDFDRSKIQKNHRHLSHLMSLYPGNFISRNASARPELMKAAVASMNDRGDESTGWARAYKLNLWARTGDSDRAYKLLRGLLTDCTFDNLWDFHPPFQIDGNFGGSAGIAEMLLQSHEFAVRPLPALPEEWENGEYQGLCARGGFEISVKWEKRTPVVITVKSLAGEELRIFTRLTRVECGGKPVECVILESPERYISFATEKGKTYMIG